MCAGFHWMQFWNGAQLFFKASCLLLFLLPLFCSLFPLFSDIERHRMTTTDGRKQIAVPKSPMANHSPYSSFTCLLDFVSRFLYMSESVFQLLSREGFRWACMLLFLSDALFHIHTVEYFHGIYWFWWAPGAVSALVALFSVSRWCNNLWPP